MDLIELRAGLEGRLLTSGDEMAPFMTDWRGRWHGRALAVAQPETVKGVQAVVRWCAAHGVPIVPQGGNTGLVGGSVPDADGRALVLSLSRLRAIRGVDRINGTIIAEAGCVLADLQAAAAAHERLFPLSLGSEGTCTLGGNLSTNAGGVQVLRYGNARELCLGLEVVTAEGDLWTSLRGLRKDNTGYQLRDLYIGGEGTLGVITAATMKLFTQPAAQITSMAALPGIPQALALLELAQRRLGASVTALELIDDQCIALAIKHFPSHCRRPLEVKCPAWVLLECSDATGAEHTQQACEAMLAEALDAGLVLDATVAGSMAQSRELWRLRGLAAEAQVKDGPNFKHDISLPISAIPSFVAGMHSDLPHAFPGCSVLVFGHLGDGNLHFNVVPPPGLTSPAFEELEARVNRRVYDAVDAAGGSISAEHGLGRTKVADNERYKSKVELDLMARIKRALDPKGLMNPGRVLHV